MCGQLVKGGIDNKGTERQDVERVGDMGRISHAWMDGREENEGGRNRKEKKRMHELVPEISLVKCVSASLSARLSVWGRGMGRMG